MGILVIIFFVVAIMYMIVSIQHKSKISKALPTKATVLNTRQGGIARFVTFELENGQRVELQVPNAQFGTFVIGDLGTLTYFETTFSSFTRG